MIYIDTSSLLKLLFNEPDSEAVRDAVAAEEDVRVSALARLEARVQLKAAWLAGEYNKGRCQKYVKKLESFSAMDPFRFVSLPGSVFATAIEQDEAAGAKHLRTLDRLHLAAMDELGVSRLMTSDLIQAAAAERAGFEVVVPTK